jgi:3-hydroxybutyryl-CoA dehydratase
MKRITWAPESYDEISLGDYYEKKVLITEQLVRSFAEVTDDFNPIHLDAEYAKKTFFKRRVAHGLLPVGFIGAVFGTALPGPGSVYLYQNVEFKAPVFLGDAITVRAEVISLGSPAPKVTLRTTVTNQFGAVVVSGEGAVLFKPPEKTW